MLKTVSLNKEDLEEYDADCMDLSNERFILKSLKDQFIEDNKKIFECIRILETIPLRIISE